MFEQIEEARNLLTGWLNEEAAADVMETKKQVVTFLLLQLGNYRCHAAALGMGKKG